MLETVATEIPRLLACNGSRLLGGSRPPSETDPTARREGIAAHWLIATCFRGGDNPSDLIGAKAPNGITITNAIAASVVEYLAHIRSVGGLIEHDLMLSGSDWRAACRPDHYMLDMAALEINDFKHGFRIVEPKENWTMIAYAAAVALESNYFPNTIILRVHQPRVPHPLGSPREWRMTKDELWNRYHFMNQRLTNLDSTLNSGPHCDGCANALNCPALRTAVFNSVDISTEAHAENLSDQQIAAELEILSEAEKRLKARKKQLDDLAIYRLKQGAVIDGYSLDRSLSNRAWKSGFQPQFLSAILRVPVAREEAITPSQAIEAGADKALVERLSERKETGMKLTRVSADTKAARMFGRK